MAIDYLKQFPIAEAQLPRRLRSLLERVGDQPDLRVEVSARYDFDQYGPNREYVHMVMALAPMNGPEDIPLLEEASNGVVSFSKPDVRQQGGLNAFEPSISGLDYVVASWRSGSFYAYNLAEKVWMGLGLSPRCLGGDQQRVIYDDLALPEFGVAEGEISTEYYFSPKRDVSWVMSNEYLRRYLWMRGAFGVRVFFYEALLPDRPELRSLMAGESQVTLKPEGGWCELDIREFKDSLLIQVWATVKAVTPELCPEQSADGLIWPGVNGPVTHDRADALVELTPVYLDDRFLERYEQSSFFGTTPVNVHGRWHCSPSYQGQWSFTDCVRIGRNLVRVPMRELYKPKPDRDIRHAHAFAVDPALVATLDLQEEHIVAKTQRLLDQLLRLGDNLAALGAAVGLPKPAVEIVKFSTVELRANGWMKYPELSRLAQVAPLAMTEQAFLSRSKSLYELWQRIPNGFLRSLVERAGHPPTKFKDFSSLKLLQALLNIVERLNADGENVNAFAVGAEPDDLNARNAALAPLFVNNELRKADAHDVGGNVLRNLEALGVDIASVNRGYGRALDAVMDGVISAFTQLNEQLARLLVGR
ncbi:MAG: hypothetical protein ABR929_13605 [Roseiarcus sp.]